MKHLFPLPGLFTAGVYNYMGCRRLNFKPIAASTHQQSRPSSLPRQ